jgi:hypothetical protein
LKGEIEKKNQFSKRKKKNEGQNWHKKMFWLKGEIENSYNFYREPRKKLEIKTMTIKLENIVPSILIEWWN